MKRKITLVVNKKEHEIEVEPWWTLADCLRDELGLTGVKVSCNQGDCGTCTVFVNGQPKLSCLMLAVSAEGKEITTIEGLSEGDKLHPLQEAFIENHGMQCGTCTPGIILSAKALLDRNPTPSEQDVKEAISGNLCRCGAYPKIIKSILAAAKTMGGS